MTGSLRLKEKFGVEMIRLTFSSRSRSLEKPLDQRFLSQRDLRFNLGRTGLKGLASWGRKRNQNSVHGTGSRQFSRKRHPCWINGQAGDQFDRCTLALIRRAQEPHLLPGLHKSQNSVRNKQDGLIRRGGSRTWRKQDARNPCFLRDLAQQQKAHDAGSNG